MLNRQLASEARVPRPEVTLPADGLIAVVKRDCPTCELTAPVLAELAAFGGLTVFTQDDPTFPETVADRIDDTGAERLAPVAGSKSFRP